MQMVWLLSLCLLPAHGRSLARMEDPRVTNVAAAISLRAVPGFGVGEADWFSALATNPGATLAELLRAKDQGKRGSPKPDAEYDEDATSWSAPGSLLKNTKRKTLITRTQTVKRIAHMQIMTTIKVVIVRSSMPTLCSPKDCSTSTSPRQTQKTSGETKKTRHERKSGVQTILALKSCEEPYSIYATCWRKKSSRSKKKTK